MKSQIDCRNKDKYHKIYPRNTPRRLGMWVSDGMFGQQAQGPGFEPYYHIKNKLIKKKDFLWPLYRAAH